MSRIVDNLVAYKILYMLVKPFAETDAYKYGIIDEKGKVLKKVSTLSTTKERDSYTYLHRLVFNVKKIINKLPGGESKLKNIVAALWLVRECYEKTTNQILLEKKLGFILEKIENDNLILVEEEILVERFMAKVSEDAPANVTGAGVSTNEPVVFVKNKKRINKPEDTIIRLERRK